MTRGRRRASVLLTASSAAFLCLGISPISHYHDLVAGAGAPGFEDGDFHRARFAAPAGMVLDARRSALYVSDRDNHRIRVIWLNENNRVSTLAGSGRKGKEDGVGRQAAFDQPTAMVALSPDLLVVNDEGNALFRAIDLKTGSVTTLAGNGARGVDEGPARGVPLGGVWNLLFVPAENALYFSQPGYYTLRKIDLKSRQVTTVLQAHPLLPNPTALALFEGEVCVADLSGPVFTLSASPPGQPPGLNPRWMGSKIMAMAAGGGRLYALQAEPGKTWNCLSERKDVPFPRVWGEMASVDYLEVAEDEPAAIVADTRRDRSFFTTAASWNAVLCWKDYRFGELSDPFTTASTGLIDFEYPEKKPPGTFRILLLGDSRVFTFDPGPRENERQPQRIEALPKRLELMLETLGALDGSRVRYEVLTLARVSWDPLLIWPNYTAADFARRYDVDLILLMLPPTTTTAEAYLERPITAQGIPADQIDPEYLLKPFAEKMRGNPVAPLVERCRVLGWLHVTGSGQASLEGLSTLLQDRDARQELLRLFGRPLRLVRKSLASGWGHRRAPPFVICYLPLGTRGSGLAEQSFWRALCEQEGVSWLDLLGPLTVLEDTWYPITEKEGYGHFTSNGHALVAFVLAHELIRTGRVRVRPLRLDPIVVWSAAGGLLLVLLAVGLAMRWAYRRGTRSQAH